VFGLDSNNLGNQFRRQLEGDGGFDFLKLLKQQSTQQNTINSTGPYVAKVLRVERMPAGVGASWLSGMKRNIHTDGNHTNNPSPNPLAEKLWVKIHGRITSAYLTGQPEIHSWIPDPEQLGSPEELGEDFASDYAISMHDVFIGMIKDSKIPTPGDLVWVDYLDKRNLKKPIYIKPLDSTGASGAKTLKPTCASNAFAKQAPSGQDFFSKKPTPESADIPDRQRPISSDEFLLPHVVGGAMIPETVDPTDLFSLEKEYKLAGYIWTDFTNNTTLFRVGDRRNNLEKTVAMAEVIYMYYKWLYPNKDIKVQNPSAATKKKNAQDQRGWGRALNVTVVVNGQRESLPDVWAALMVLVINGKLPDNSLGAYNLSKGNRIKTFGKNLEGVNNNNGPYIDWREKCGTGTFSKSKWLWQSTGNPTNNLAKTHWDNKTAADLAGEITTGSSESALRFPKRYAQALTLVQSKEFPTDLPDWSTVIAFRKKNIENDTNLLGATVIPPTTELVAEKKMHLVVI